MEPSELSHFPQPRNTGQLQEPVICLHEQYIDGSNGNREDF